MASVSHVPLPFNFVRSVFSSSSSPPTSVRPSHLPRFVLLCPPSSLLSLHRGGSTSVLQTLVREREACWSRCLLSRLASDSVGTLRRMEDDGGSLALAFALSSSVVLLPPCPWLPPPTQQAAASLSLSLSRLSPSPPSLRRQLQSRQTCSSWLVARLPNSKLESAARAV